MGYSISQNHFSRWLSLWKETIKDLFEGQVADKALNQAETFAKVFYERLSEVQKKYK